MTVDDLLPRPIASEPFRRDRQVHVPAVRGCYVLTTASGTILYLGLSVDLRGRMGQHLDAPEKVAPTVDGRAVLFHWLEVDNIEAVERGWLNSHRVAEGRLPILNKMNSPVAG